MMYVIETKAHACMKSLNLLEYGTLCSLLLTNLS